MMTQEQSQEIWSLIKDIEVAVLTTQSGDGLRARPMYQAQKKFDGTMWFLTSDESAKTCELNENQQVCLAYAEPKKGVFVSMLGTAGFIKDRALIKKFWNSAAAAWIDGNGGSKELTLLEVHIEQAEAWDSKTNAMKRLFETVRSGLTDSEPVYRENRKYG